MKGSYLNKISCQAKKSDGEVTIYMNPIYKLDWFYDQRNKHNDMQSC